MQPSNLITSNYYTPKKVLYISLFLLLLFSTIFRIVDHGWKDVVMSDGKGYYAYLPATIIFHDLDYSFYEEGKAGEHAKDCSAFIYYIDGARVNKYPSGVAVLQLPFFLMALLITWITGFSMTGYSFFFQLFVSLAAIFYTLLGSGYLYRFLLSFKLNEKRALFTTFIILFGTNLLNYTVFEPSMSHCYSFAMVAGFTFHLRRYFLENKNSDWLIACIYLGIILLIRQINGLVILSVPLIAGEWETLYGGLKNLFRKPGYLILGIVFSTLILSIQPLLWHAQNGHWFVYTYLNEGFNFNHPAILKVLFSYRKGWLLYTPVFLLLIPSLILILFQRRWFMFLGNTIFWIPFIYVASSWWCWYYGGSFGQRVFVDFYPLAAIGLGLLINSTGKKIILISLNAVLFILIFLNLIQTYQYTKNIIHYDRMDKEKYWANFLKTESSASHKFYENPERNVPAGLPGQMIKSWFTEFDDSSPDWINWRNDDIADEALSGNKAIIIQKGKESSPVLKVSLTGEELKNASILVSAWYIQDRVATDAELKVFIEKENNEVVYSTTIKINQQKSVSTKDTWTKIHCIVQPDELPVNENYKLNIYLYNESPRATTFDDLGVFLYKKP